MTESLVDVDKDMDDDPWAGTDRSQEEDMDEVPWAGTDRGQDDDDMHGNNIVDESKAGGGESRACTICSLALII